VQPGRVIVKVYRRKTPVGNFAFMIPNYVNGKRRFDCYASEVEALEAAETLAKRLDARDYKAANMTEAQAIEFINATQMLQPFGISLTAATTVIVEAVKKVGDLAAVATAISFYNAKHKSVTPKNVPDVITELLALKKARGASDRYMEDLQFRLDKFNETFKSNIGTITTANIQTWLDGLKLSSQSYANNRRVVHLLFEYAVARGYALDNPAAKVERPKIRNGECEVFTPDEAEKLLKAAPEDWLPCLAIGLFAGLRSAEIERLEWKDIDLKQRHIIVGADKAKTASRRIVPIAENLALWLAPYANSKDGVWPHGRICFHKREQSTAKTAGIVWKRNAMRHSFASYSFALSNDAARIAGYCGNSTAVIHRHYRQLTTPADALKFFSLNPPAKAIPETAAAVN